jgi:F0F1-type ATP synthase assembly protein I
MVTRNDKDTGDAPATPRHSPSLWRFAAIGTEFFSPILGGAILGYYLDEYFRLQPILAVSGVFLGIILGFYRLFVELREFQKNL